MSIREIIDDIENQLTWEVIKEYIQDGDEEITCDPWARTHTITIPRSRHRDIEYLHELAHAVLAERHHLLATAWFSRSTQETVYRRLVDPIRTASDWFADALLMQWVPDLEQEEIREHVRYTNWSAAEDAADPFILYGGGLLWAQGIYYLGYNMDAVPEPFLPPAKILLQTDPGNPTIEAKQGLVNALAALTCQQRIEIAQEEDCDVWIVRGVK